MMIRILPGECLVPKRTILHFTRRKPCTRSSASVSSRSVEMRSIAGPLSKKWEVGCCRRGRCAIDLAGIMKSSGKLQKKWSHSWEPPRTAVNPTMIVGGSTNARGPLSSFLEKTLSSFVTRMARLSFLAPANTTGMKNSHISRYQKIGSSRIKGMESPWIGSPSPSGTNSASHKRRHPWGRYPSLPPEKNKGGFFIYEINKQNKKPPFYGRFLSVDRTGLEPATSSMPSKRSSQLS